MKKTRNYQFKWISGRLQSEVIHAKPIFSNVKIFYVCPIVNWFRNLRISGVDKDKDAIVMEVGTNKGK